MSTYNKTVWQDGDIITADKMNNIENGIYSYNEDITNLQTNKQDALTFDQTPTDESANPVTSVGIKNAIEAAVDVTAPGIYESASGSIVSFKDGADDLPMKSAVVNIEPIQDLHGYDSPWPAGGGVNKADLTGAAAYSDGTYGMYVTVDGEEITLAGTWTNRNVTGIWRFLSVPNIPSDLNVVAFESTSGNHVNDIRQDGTNNRLIIGLTNMVNGQAYTIKFKIVAYEGSTAPTEWTPYSNICPISGRTGVSVVRSGKNLCDQPIGRWLWTSNGLRFNNTNGTYCATEDRMPVKGGEQYIVSFTDSGQNLALYFAWFNEDGFIKADIKWGVPLTATAPQNATKVALTFSNNENYTGEPKISNVQLELGSTATEYEPYVGSTYDITFPSEAGTVYGGTLDVVSGKLVVDRAMVDLGTLTWEYISSDKRFYCRVYGWKEYTTSQVANAICSQYYPVSRDNLLSFDKCFSISTNVLSFINICDTAYSDATTFKTAMNGVQLVYELATPIEIQLAPRETRTLLGENNIWSDAGDISVKYPADTKMYIDQKITEAIAAAMA